MWNPDKTTEDSDQTNGRRAERAELAVLAASKHRGDMENLDEESITDLLADMLHLCDREGIPAEQLIDFALLNWRAER